MVGSPKRDTPGSKGILDHSRLGQIWNSLALEHRYTSHHYPYLLRLMEKFDISYRLEDGNHSLVAQLVPAQRPVLPWDTATPPSGDVRTLSLSFDLSEAMPGLMSALTVRLNYADAGLRWHSGVFLRHPNAMYASEALIEQSERELRLQVRAPSPDMFFTCSATRLNTSSLGVGRDETTSSSSSARRQRYAPVGFGSTACSKPANAVCRRPGAVSASPNTTSRRY